MEVAKSPPPTVDTLVNTDSLIKADQDAKQSNATEPHDDILAFGANSIGEIEKLMEQLRAARDYLRSEAERVRRVNARYAHLTRTASASVKIISESMGKWHTTEMQAANEAGPGTSPSHA